MINNQDKVVVLPREVEIECYAQYNQAVNGDYQHNQHGREEYVLSDLNTAWYALKGMSQATAMEYFLNYMHEQLTKHQITELPIYPNMR